MVKVVQTYEDGAWNPQEESGGGGSQPGVARVLGPFPVAFDTPGLVNGVTFYTPTVGDILLDCWFQLTVAWDGTTPGLDIGTFVGFDYGLFGGGVPGAPFDLSNGPDDELLGAGYLCQENSLNKPMLFTGMNAHWSGTQMQYDRYAPGKFTAANPLKVVVSQDGTKGGADPGSTVGSGAIYLVVATPSVT